MSRAPTVLLADDEPALLDLYATWLGDADVDVVRANCGATALARCDDTDIDAAILDRRMPRVSGDEVLDALRRRGRTPRAAFVTATTPDVRIVDLDIGAYLVKPVGQATFVALVRSLVERERLPELAERYVAALSKRAALLEAESPTVLRSDPTYVSFEEELSRLARRVDRCLDDPYLERVLPDEGPFGTSPGSTA